MSDSANHQKRPASRVLAALCAEHWAITDHALRQMEQIARRELSADLTEFTQRQFYEAEHNSYVRDGVAVIPVCGPMFRYANLFTQMSGASSYDVLAKDLSAALANPAVKSILLAVDSPGGECNGCSEFAEMIYKARGVKPIVAYVGGQASSAAYWIASAADRIVANETAVVGCIGTVSGLVDVTKRNEMDGIRELTIVSSGAPKKNLGANGITPEAIDAVLRTLNALEAGFWAGVARNRGVSVEKVASDYGQGAVFVAGHSGGKDDPTGLSAGLVDDLGDFESLLAEMSAETAAAPASDGVRATFRAVPFASNLTSNEAARWNAQKEERALRNRYGMTAEQYEGAFLVVQDRGGHKAMIGLHHALRDGMLVAPVKAIRDAARQLDAMADLPADVRAAAMSHIDAHLADTNEHYDWKNPAVLSAATAPTASESHPESPMDPEMKAMLEGMKADIADLKSHVSSCHAESMGGHTKTQDMLDTADAPADHPEGSADAAPSAAAVATLIATSSPEIAALTGETDPAKQMGVLTAWKEAASRLPAEQADAASLREEATASAEQQKEAAIQAAVDIAVKGDESTGLKPRYLPGHRAQAEQLCRSLGADAFYTHLKALPPTSLSAPARQPHVAAPGNSGVMTPAMKEAARVAGMTDEQFLAADAARVAQLERRGLAASS